MRHIDLFSGIGGFALAVDTVWPGSQHIFCDNDLFCQQVLKKHWPNSKIYGDIRTFTNTDRSRSGTSTSHTNQDGQEIGEEWEQSQSQPSGQIDILTGGFPCQPFSQAGRRKGTDDDRYLWPEMFRVIREFKPTWVIAENVRGLLTWNEGMVLEQVCADLESEGYEVQPLIIPAVAVNAPHRRDRVWFIAHRKDKHEEWSNAERGGSRESQAQIGNRDSDAQDTISERGRWRVESSGQVLGSKSTEAKDARPSWESNWIEVATELCTVDDGLPNGLVRPRGWRNVALKAAGNAIVPQVAIQIMQAIKLTQ